jgi:hypothetical protein
MSTDPTGQPPVVVPRLPAAPVPEQVRDRVQWPALFLIANASISVLVALFQITRFLAVVDAPPDDFSSLDRTLWQMTARKDQGFVFTWQEYLRTTTPEQRKRQRALTEGIIALVLLVPAGLALAGGVCMHQLRCWPLAMVGALASAAPCVSPLTCCGVGEVVGVWCVVALLRPEVREAFT